MSYDYDAPHWLDQFEGRFTPAMKIVLSSGPIPGLIDMRDKQEVNHKPRGLWYACGDEWLEWLSSEMPDWRDQITHIYQLLTAPLSPWPANGEVAFLQTVKDIDEFTEDYGKKTPWSFGNRVDSIDWPAVARDFPGGIEICPYHWERRRSDASWYYPWDVASGCLWGPAGYRSLHLLATKPGGKK